MITLSERRRLQAQCNAVLRTHAKTFSFAGWLLTAAQRETAAVVYAFCRAADDAVDEAPTASAAHRQITDLHGQLTGALPPTPLVELYLQIQHERSIAPAAALELLQGMASDLGVVRMADDAELLQYCYRAAGTVGLMMCGVLGVTHADAFAHAIDLGIAMQLTNICRDVAEDAARNRVYLPAARLAGYGASPDLVLRNQAGPAERAVIAELLALADEYYANGRAGYCYLPARARPAIATAANLYRHIGQQLADGGFDARQRTGCNIGDVCAYVGPYDCQAIGVYFWPGFNKG